MASSIWPSVSGAAAQSQALDVIANNLANVDTAGYKKDQATFKEYLANVERDPESVGMPRLPIKDKDFYPIEGRDQAFVVMDGTYTNFRQGNLKVTHAPLDVALDGPGFFEVSTPEGVRYTRQGSFKLAMDGRLVTSEGYPVLASQPGGLAPALPATVVQPGQGGLATQGGVEVGRGINLSDVRGKVTITETGEVYAGEDLITKLSVIEFLDPLKLKKSAGLLFENGDAANTPAASGRTKIMQGMIETSNVNPVEEISNMIRTQRMYEHDLKVMKTYDDLMGREANDIGKL